MKIPEQAATLLETGPICDACLGRPFADRSFGLTNAERGRALRTTLALDADEPYETVEPVDCWVCEGYCGAVDAIAETVVEALDGVSFETYQVGTSVPPLCEENDRLLREDGGLDPDCGEPLKREINREVGRRVGAATGADVDFERPDVLVVIDLAAFDPFEVLEEGASVTDHAIDRQVNPAFVYGRYRKIERDVPQTEWPCRECGASGVQLADHGEEPCDHCGGSGYMYETSVEQTVRPHVVEAMDGREGTFHGAGREDVDARMLGTGRPFVLEVKRPRERRPDVEALEDRINEAADGRVEVEGLRLATYDMVERVKEHDASKRYRAAVSFDEPVNERAFEAALDELDGTTVEQYTPQRVDHRRAALTRERTVHEIGGELDTEALDSAEADPADVHGSATGVDHADEESESTPFGVDERVETVGETLSRATDRIGELGDRLEEAGERADGGSSGDDEGSGDGPTGESSGGGADEEGSGGGATGEGSGGGADEEGSGDGANDEGGTNGDDGSADATTGTVEIHGEGGLYVKELISGDEGRTEPSLAGLLGTGATVTALDVLAVEGEDEPFEREDYFRDEDVTGEGATDEEVKT